MGFRKSGNQRQYASDSMVIGASEFDDIVPIIGPTGSGKSTFINTYLRKNSAPVGIGLKSTTADVQHYIVEHPFFPNRRLLLVDTPGFDDTYVDDAEILRRIAIWLGRSYHDGMKLAGIVYLHEIYLDRVTGTALKNQNLFKKLCGDDALQYIVPVTTKWSRLASADSGPRRETELKDIFWKDMLPNGSSITRFEDTAESAKTVVCGILSKRSINVTLRIQEELVDLRKYLPQTDAGKTLYDDLQRLHDRFKGELTQLRDMDRAEQDAKWRKEYADVMDRIETIRTEIKLFKVPLTQKILGLVGLQSGISFK